MTATVTYSGFWKRSIAQLIDTVLLIIINMLVGTSMLTILSTFTGFNPNSYHSITSTFLLFPCEVFLYYTLLESSKYYGTLGKKIVGIKVVDYNFNKISFFKAALRLISKLLSCIGFIGFLIVPFTKNKQGLHDIIAGCLVINKE